MRGTDVIFQMNSGSSKGEKYGFTLAVVDGQKAFTASKVHYQAPSMIKEKIDLVLTARKENINLTGAMELRLVAEILDELEIISAETTAVTFWGLDGIKRSILVGDEGAKVVPIVHELGKDPEYRISISLWGLHE